MLRFKNTAWIEINSKAIVNNINKIRKYIGEQTEIIGVVKGDAYGHGAKEISRLLIHSGVKRLAVATVEEGIELRIY